MELAIPGHCLWWRRRLQFSLVLGGTNAVSQLNPQGFSGGGDLPVELTREIMLELALPCSTDLYFGER